jgi:hypothetical protein
MGKTTEPEATIYQSAAADIARQVDAESASKGTLESIGETQGALILSAAESIATLRDRGQTEFDIGARAAVEAMSPDQLVKVCASIGMQYLMAKVTGDAANAERLKSELTDSQCDPRWAETLDAYVKYFRPLGTRRKIPYIRPTADSPPAITINSGARIGLLGDWGTGGEAARRILQQLKAQKPDIVIHLGDIYYSGTNEECHEHFEVEGQTTNLYSEIIG